jgi:Skp family chaperone for outer membrane proteins
MVVSSRAIVAVGLGLVGMGVLVGPSLGQQSQDGSVRKTSTRGTTPAPPTPPVFGSVDMAVIFKGYDKVKVTGEEIKAAAMTKKNDLMKIMQEMQQESELLAKMTPGSIDFKKHESRITELKAKGEAEREQAERDFALREAEMVATIYKEIQDMVGLVAKYRGMTYVIRVSNDPVVGTDPQSAWTAVQRTVVYADPSNDITNDVIYNLNRRYKAANGGVTPKAASSAATPGTGAATKPKAN